MTNVYTTGADVEVYLTDGPTMPDFTALEPLDIETISIIEEGTVLPLYGWADRLARHMADGTRLVSGLLEFNYSAAHMRHRRGWSKAADTLGSIRGATLWIRLTGVTYEGWGQPVIVRDTVRLDSVWEHPFQHTPDPKAVESVPFTARSAILVARQRREPNLEAVGRFASEGDVQLLTSGSAFRRTETLHPARISYVHDGDTFRVELTDPAEGGRLIEVRLVGVDAPETEHTSKKYNRDDDAAWRWPFNAPESDRGAGGESPTKEQLDAWGTYVAEHIRGLLPKETNIWLVRDEGDSPMETPGFDPLAVDEESRYLFHVRTLTPLPNGGTDVATYLLEQGFAVPFYSTSIGINEEGQPYSRMALLERIYQQAREKAGTDEAKGVWYSFDVNDQP